MILEASTTDNALWVRLDGVPLLEQRVDSDDVKSRLARRMYGHFVVVWVCVINVVL